jgi:putative transposase
VNVYPFIEAEELEQRNVKRARGLLQVSRAANHAQRSNGPSQREQDDAELTEAIEEVHRESKGGVTGRRASMPSFVWPDAGTGKRRIVRLMRAAKIRARTPKRWKKTTITDPAAAARTDLVRRDFRVDASRLNARWGGDINYVPT